MKSGFHDKIVLSKAELASLKEIVKVSHSAPWIFKSIDGLNSSKSATLCGIYSNDILVSFAWYMSRTCVINNMTFIGLSIGVVTTLPSHRHNGYAKKLISRIEEIACRRNIDFLYLAGIPGFYKKYGFRGFAPKSKLIFRKSDLPEASGFIENMSNVHLKEIKKMHSIYSNEVFSTLSRDAHEWEDLIGPLSSTFLFYRPKVILDKNRQLIAYFCSTPDNNTVREFVPLLDVDSATTALYVIANSTDYCDQETIEIYSPSAGPLWETSKNSIGADFVCFLRPYSSNMIKWISNSKDFYDFRCEFILQGDML